MNRTPVFFLNGVLSSIILPVFLVLMAKTGSIPFGRISLGIMASGHSELIILIAALYMIICGGLNGTSSSAFSREGKQFWISKVIPVAPRKQAMAKFIHSYVIGTLGCAAALAGIIIIIPINPLHLAVATGLALITDVLLTAVGMLIDLARPLLDWTNPQKAIKNNLNVLLSMLADVAIVAAAIFGIRALDKAGASDSTILFVLFIALSGLASLSYLVLLRFADKRYQDIDN